MSRFHPRFVTNGVNQGFSQGFGLYPTFSFISHSCSPNARFQIFENHSLLLFDPSEFGSNLSAVSCKECITGILLPKISTDMKSEWKCSECKYEVKIQFKIDSWTQTLNPNNYLIFLLNRRLLDVLCTNDNFETREDLEKVLLLARDILKIVDLIEPGLSTTRGRILKQIHKPSLKLAKNDLKDGKINSQEFLLITKDIIKNMKTAVRCFEEFNLEESNEIYDRKLVKQSQM
ncbi:SMYD [Lepeophtheirus salmonis]|uniref:SMYD n=1 Tax=Lepeophtheirus salmonis TaxID=72036 RepID=A0A7R8H766_LEPSM|nr:SMYD [Lepeophtheirus salmonis]CAF2902208.1 SMYD [Lepeophtheirus salmonis]